MKMKTNSFVSKSAYTGNLDKLSATKKEEISEAAGNALEFLRSIYQEFDLMNGELYELQDTLDKEEFEWFHDFWMKFPTYNQLDELEGFLVNLRAQIEGEKA